MSKILDIFCEYTSGAKTLEESNTAMNEVLNESGFGIFLTEEDHSFTEEERSSIIVSDDPFEVNGYGLLDIGDCIIRKVKVTNGTIPWIVNEINVDGSTSKYALIIIGGRYYEVKGNYLAII